MPKPLTGHRIKHWMLRDRIMIVVVGCGGTGAALVYRFSKTYSLNSGCLHCQGVERFPAVDDRNFIDFGYPLENTFA